MECYDAHIHCFYSGSFEKLFKEFQENPGFLGGALLMFVDAPEDMDQALKMIPRSYHSRLTREAINPGEKIVAYIQKHESPSFIPYADTRYFTGSQVKNLERHVGEGYRGVKVLYVPEYDGNLHIQGWEKSMGRSVSQSEQVMADIFSECRRLDLPVLFHADLRAYGTFVDRLLEAYPEVPVNIPHFGSSRREMARFLEKHRNCYSDFSSLLPFMKESPEAYRDFIRSHADRILFGSDALIGTPGVLREYMSYVDQFLEVALKDTLKANYLRFHKLR